MNRPGFALLLVLLVVGAVELLTLSTLALATHESVSVSAHERAIQASRAAEAALRRVARKWPIPAVDSLRISQATTLADSNGVTIAVRRNTWGQYHAVASLRAGPLHVRETMALHTLDLERALAEATGAIVTQSPVVAPNVRLVTDQNPCAASIAQIANDTTLLAAPGYAFGGLGWTELASVADSGFVYAATGVIVPPGLHAGVLVVDADITFVTGAVFNGLIVSRGAIRIEDGVHITGAIIHRGRGSVTVGNADLTYSRCVVGQALLQTPAWRRLARSARRFLPAF